MEVQSRLCHEKNLTRNCMTWKKNSNLKVDEEAEKKTWPKDG